MRNEGFSYRYKRLPRAAKYRSRKRNEIIEKCGITQGIFYRLYQGFVTIPDHHKETIATILSCNVQDLN